MGERVVSESDWAGGLPPNPHCPRPLLPPPYIPPRERDMISGAALLATVMCRGLTSAFHFIL